jgi:hypothetical protein
MLTSKEKQRSSFKNDSCSRWVVETGQRNNASSIHPLKVTNKYVNMDKIEQIARMPSNQQSLVRAKWR